MPDKETIRRAKRDKAEGKAPTTQAGEFIREEMDHIREGKHGARSTKQAIAIGLSQARRAGVKLPPPKKGQASEKTRQSAKRADEQGQDGHRHKTSAKRSRATIKALKREGHEAASSKSLSKQARQQSRQRTAAQRSEIGRKAARTRMSHQSHAERSRIARKAAKTRAARALMNVRRARSDVKRPLTSRVARSAFDLARRTSHVARSSQPGSSDPPPLAWISNRSTVSETMIQLRSRRAACHSPRESQRVETVAQRLVGPVVVGLVLVGLVLVGPFAVGAGRLAAADVRWHRINLDKTFRSEGVAAFDVNNDGKTDVVAGDVWYEAPDWKMREIRTPGKYIFNGGYSDSFCNFGYDVNGDGWVDQICIGFPGADCHWYENPQNAPGHWKEHLIWHSACNETPNFQDLLGNGKRELIMGSQPEDQMGYLPIPPAAEAASKWTFNPVSVPGDPKKQGLDNGSHRFYHGLGVGDFNQDGRNDVIIRDGWWEAPQDRAKLPWAFHPFKMERTDKSWGTECANIWAEDLDHDGDMDLISSSAHAYGVWWWENLDGTTLRQHVIDKSFSQTHALIYVDINGDGQRDIVTGKRFFAHNGHDPGGHEPVVMVWYEVKRTKGAPPQFFRHEIVEGRDTGIGTQFQVTDVNGDGRPDIVLSNKKGVNILLQQSP